MDANSKLPVGTLAGWRKTGLSSRRLRMLIDSGELVKIRHGAYAMKDIVAEARADPALRHALQVAVVLGTREGGVTSHQSAARLWRLSQLGAPADETVTLTVPPGPRTGGYARSGVVCHPAKLPATQVRTLYGLPVTSAARTAVDIARASTFMAGVVVTDSALHERHASKADLRRVLASCQRWPGVARAQRAVEFASPLAESALESCARVAFREQDLPPPTLQAQIIGLNGRFVGRVDFCWQQYRTIAEADGLGKYHSGEKAIAELKRDRLLREAGYEVVHFTWQELFAGPARVAARVRGAFRRAIRVGGS